MMEDQHDGGQMSSTEQDLAMFLAGGGDLDSLLGSGVYVTSSEAILTVPFVHDNGVVETVSLEALSPLENMRMAFASIIALRTQEIELSTLRMELIKLAWFVTFVAERELLHIRLIEVDNGLLQSFRDFLDVQRTPDRETVARSAYAAQARVGGRPLSVDYKQEIYRTLVETFKRLRLHPDFKTEIRPDLNLNTHRLWTKRSKRHVVPILTRPELKMLVRLCREEVEATTLRLRAYWRTVDGYAVDGDDDLVDPSVAREVYAMGNLFGDALPPPCRDEMRVVVREDGSGASFRKKTFPRLWSMNGPQYQDAVGLLYPSPMLLLPFCLLFAVYYRYNPDVLGALKRSDLTRQPSVFGERLKGTPFKNRAKRKQHASWPITTDAHNPAVMIETIARWTSSIIPHATLDQQEHLFLFRDNNRNVRSFATPHTLRRALSKFLDRHGPSEPDENAKLGAKRFTPRSIRPSVIDLVHHLFDGDVIAASHAGQHRSVDTTIEHYLQDGARKRNDERLAPVTGAMQTWVETSGLIDPRLSNASASFAATPGWECADLNRGHIAGEEQGVPCRAYGRCVSCELGKIDTTSPIAYALAVKLREAMERGRTLMPEHAWLERWQPELDALERLIALGFTTLAVASAYLDIPDLPTVE
ncbi:hypothetical protein [Sphingobium yanoikuyae]|uniref:Uncharacterized protein n=1 Tax=Sphingobium yanoikuyae TaxID=13690 RepID=A0A430BDQ1_SPHYA|nr:hypothetical protein [Sphingobium yanoikuyae]RSU46916.1 hypothetical protein DAH51_25360 [Sphingobium yanoikuyae]